MDEKTDKTPKDGEGVEDEDSEDSRSSLEEADGRHFTATLVITPADERGPEEVTDDTGKEKVPIPDIPSTEPEDTDEPPSTTEAKSDQPPSLCEEDADKQTSPPDGAEADEQSAITRAETAESPPPSLSEEDADKQTSPDGTEADEQSAITRAETAESPSPSLSDAEVSTKQARVARQMQLVRQEQVTTDSGLDSELELEAACSLRRSGPRDSSGPQEVLVEMDTFNRSSTRRDSFIMAIASGEEREIDTSAVIRTSGTQKTTDGHSGAAGRERYSDLNLEAGSISDVEDLELFFHEDNSPWDTLSECCRGRRRWVICGTVLLLLALMFPIILIPQSLVYVEYYQMALARSRVTGRVDRERTLYGGCYLLLPDSELVVFKATAHHLHLRLQVTAAEGLSLGLEVSLQYFLRGEELGQLHVQYGERYEGVVERVVESEVKNSVVNFTLDQYRFHRDTLQHAIHSHLAHRLQGDCCPQQQPPCVNGSQGGCSGSGSGSISSMPCSPSPNCSRGLHLTLRPEHVQLGAVDIPREVSERYLRFILLQVEAEKETLVQEATIEKKRTELLTRDLKNLANETMENARSTSKKVLAQAEADAELRRQQAHNQALKHLLTSLNITASDERRSLLMLLAYKQTKDPVFFLPLGGLTVWG